MASPATSPRPTRPQAYVYDAAQNYQAAGTPLVVLAGKEYGSGSSRDWAAKGTALLGVKAVVAESYERIHRSNLIGMGVLPLQYPAGESAATPGPDRYGNLRSRRRHRAERTAPRRRPSRSRQLLKTAPPSPSMPFCASIPRAKRTTTATAASCSTFCARSPHKQAAGLQLIQ